MGREYFRGYNTGIKEKGWSPVPKARPRLCQDKKATPITGGDP